MFITATQAVAGSWGRLLGLLLMFLCLSSQVGAKERISSQDRQGHFKWEGRERTFLVHLPYQNAPQRMVPLVIVLHGGGGSAAKMIKFSEGKFNDLSDREQFLVVYPDAYQRNWNDGRGLQRYPAMRENVDDVGFISALINHMIRDYAADPARVYVTGVSNGGMMTLRLACELSDKIAAVAPIIGSLPLKMADSCQPSRPVPIILFNGTSDPMVPWEGGDVRFGRLRLGKVVSVPDTVSFWAANNQCLQPVITQIKDLDPADGTRVRKEAYHQCREGADVVLYAIEGGGHTCPGRYQYLPVGIVGRTSYDIDAIEILSDFFQEHLLNN